MIKAFIKNWLIIFGAPKNLFSDNGGELSVMNSMKCVKSFV